MEIWKRKEVLGISMTFMTVDMLGGVFSLLSLVFKPSFDGVASVSYIVVIVMDGIVVISAVILNPLARKRRKREAREMLEKPPAVLEANRSLQPSASQAQERSVIQGGDLELGDETGRSSSTRVDMFLATDSNRQ